MKNIEIQDTLEELQDFIGGLKLQLEANLWVKKKEEFSRLLSSILTLLKEILGLDETFRSLLLSKVSPVVDKLTTLLNCDRISSRLLNQISFFSEKYIVDFPDECNFQTVTTVINYLLNLTAPKSTVEKSVPKTVIKRIWTLRKRIIEFNLQDPKLQDIRNKFVLVAGNTNYVTCVEGQHVIGFLMARDVEITKAMHNQIMNSIPKLSKKVAANYGAIYFVAWTSASNNDEVEKVTF